MSASTWGNTPAVCFKPGLNVKRWLVGVGRIVEQTIEVQLSKWDQPRVGYIKLLDWLGRTSGNVSRVGSSDPCQDRMRSKKR